MISKFNPEANKVYFIVKNSMYHVMEGVGGIEVDFKSFHDWDDKLIFLEKGQYIKFLNDGFTVRKIEFEDEETFRNSDFRVLFKHLISLGYINFEECTECQQYLDSAILSNPSQILDISTSQWFWQNPFKADNPEYHIIFDVKEIIDSQFKHHLTNAQIVDLIGKYDLNPQKVFSEKVGLTIRRLHGMKRLSEVKKEIAFSDKSIKEIAYDFDYNDPAYFNRVFKESTGINPMKFRESIDFNNQDAFLSNLYELIELHHSTAHNAGFYADKLNMSLKTLSRKVRDSLNLTIGELIRYELLKTIKNHLKDGVSVKETAQLLRFEEPNHLTSFFKHYSGSTPTEYLNKKVQ